MRTYRTTRGPFAEAVYFTDDDIENICLDELNELNLVPPTPQPIRIDRFIEKKFRVTPDYVNLPDGMLGCTKFGAKGVQAILVSRRLSDERTKVSERRLLATLAHEGGHGLFHAHLFEPEWALQTSLDPEAGEPDRRRVLCRENAVLTGQHPGQTTYGGEWWEVQANKAIGSLLLPRKLVADCLDQLLVTRGLLGTKFLPQDHRDQAVRLLSETFNVNPMVGRIRIAALYPAGVEAQLNL